MVKNSKLIDFYYFFTSITILLRLYIHLHLRDLIVNRERFVIPLEMEMIVQMEYATMG